MTWVARKHCSCCDKTKPRHQFNERGGGRDGLQVWCKACQKEKVREWCQKNPERARERRRRWRQENPEKNRELKRLDAKRNRKQHNARAVVFRATRDGRLKKPSACPVCGFEGAIQAHHRDYDNPLDVEWFCDPCHKQAHREVAA